MKVRRGEFIGCYLTRAFLAGEARRPLTAAGPSRAARPGRNSPSGRWDSSPCQEANSTFLPATGFQPMTSTFPALLDACLTVE